MKVTELDVDQIIPYVNNPRDNTAAIDLLGYEQEKLTFLRSQKAGFARRCPA